MGRPPAYLFVVRHGNRLDAADKQWHLSSPTPYDPPLTYGGWLQARALGVRIGEILWDRIRDDEAALAGQPVDSSAKQTRRKYKIILHSSPFLRCTQTSIGIASGIAQDPSPLESSAPSQKSPQSSHPQHPFIDGLPCPMNSKPRPTLITNLDRLRPPDSSQGGPHETRKSTLRVDAFLGEWLSPGYFDLITPPPESVMMIAGAKADLLRREDYQHYPSFNPHIHSNSHGQLWSAGSAVVSPAASPAHVAPGGLANLATMSEVLPGASNPTSRAGPNSTMSRPGQERLSGRYVPPTPHYAVSSSATIPMGYVTHARDACINLDHQWDSMRAPLSWGDGGTLGEEWPSMHQRFRKGLQNLVDWYTTAEDATGMATKTVHFDSGNATECAVEDPEDEDTEAVVILVSHSAGCNAMIGAITRQPVLMDVGIASLTMAVRKAENDPAAATPVGTLGAGKSWTRRQDAGIPLHQHYDVKLLANTEHLRSAAPTRSASVASQTGAIRGRYSDSVSSSPKNPSFPDDWGSRSSSANAALSSLRRPTPSTTRGGVWSSAPLNSGPTLGSGFTFARTSSSSSRTSSTGLWSPAIAPDETEMDYVDTMPNFSHEKARTVIPAADLPAMPDHDPDMRSSASGNEKPGERATAVTLPLAGLDSNAAFSQPPVGGIGLWSSIPRSSAEVDLIHEATTSKRRWTATERVSEPPRT